MDLFRKHLVTAYPTIPVSARLAGSLFLIDKRRGGRGRDEIYMFVGRKSSEDRSDWSGYYFFVQT